MRRTEDASVLCPPPPLLLSADNCALCAPPPSSNASIYDSGLYESQPGMRMQQMQPVPGSVSQSPRRSRSKSSEAQGGRSRNTSGSTTGSTRGGKHQVGPCGRGQSAAAALSISSSWHCIVHLIVMAHRIPIQANSTRGSLH